MFNIDFLKNIEKLEWCSVNVDNQFLFQDVIYEIDFSIDSYKVYNKYNEIHNYTNESKMDKILVVLMKNNSMIYFDENYNMIQGIHIFGYHRNRW